MKAVALASLLALFASACIGPGAEVAGPAMCAGRALDPATRCVVAGPHYDAGRIRRWLLGAGYRELWSAPISVPILDLDRTAGGLEPVEQLGHLQSATLALRGADGRAYSFRTTDKDMRRAAGSAALVPGISAAYRDQAASGHPGAPVVASVIARAAGVLESERRLAVLEPSPRLGVFRETFAGRLGTFEEYATAATAGRSGTFGALEIVDTEALFEKLRADGAERADARAYLRARLVDLLIGDIDRHPGQWRFARLAPGGAWQPLPEDRDLAFARFDGALVNVARPWFPLLGSFDAHYEIGALAAQAVVTDTRLLAPLSRSAWREETAAVQRRLTPTVVDRAVGALPQAWRELDGARLGRYLRKRISRLPAAADLLYARLTVAVEVHATDTAEHVFVSSVGGGRAAVRVAVAGQREPTFERLLHRSETESLLLCGFDASDTLSVQPLDDIEVRVERQCDAPQPVVGENGQPNESDATP